MQVTVRQLTPDEYPLWDKLIASSPQRSIFAERWWMEIVTDGGFQLLGCFAGQMLMAGMPIWPTTTLGVKRLRQPPLTPYWGPVFAPLKGPQYTQVSGEMTILRALADALLPWQDVAIQFHPSLINWMPFFWTGYTQSTRYTYRIHDLPAFITDERRMHKKIRQTLQSIHKAGITLDDAVDPEVVARMSRLSMARQGRNNSEELHRVWPLLAQAALARQRMANIAAMDSAGNVHAANTIVWDDRYAYGIFGGGDPALRGSNAGTLVLWREIELAARVVPGFDFEGSMLEFVEQFFRAFGGDLCPYLLVTRCTSNRLKFARTLLQRKEQLRQWTDRGQKRAPASRGGEQAEE